MNIQEDLRIIKTKKALQNTLISLLKEKSFEEVKVADLCKKALVNRSTFYAHYNDKYELFQSTIETLKNDLNDDLKQNENELDTLDYLMKLMELYLNHMEEKKDIYLPIVRHNKNGIIMDIICDALEKDIETKIYHDHKNESLNVPIDVIIKFYIGAIFNVGMEWLNNTQKYNKEDLLKYMNILIKKGIN